MEVILSIAFKAASRSENTIALAYCTVENKRPSGSAGNWPVKYSQSTALFNANSAAAPAKIKRIVSLFPHIWRTTDCLATKNSIRYKTKNIPENSAPECCKHEFSCKDMRLEKGGI